MFSFKLSYFRTLVKLIAASYMLEIPESSYPSFHKNKFSCLLTSKLKGKCDIGKTVLYLDMITKICPICEKEFQIRKSHLGRYRNCSKKCSALARTKNLKRICETCGNEFLVKPGALKVRPVLYCSAKCSNEARLNSLPEQKIKEMYLSGLSIYEIGEKFSVHGATIKYRLNRMGVSCRSASERAQGENNPMYGKKHTPESLEKMRLANKRQFSKKGAREKHALLTIKQIQEGKTGKAFNKLELKYAELLNKQGVSFEQQKRVGRFVFDFYLPESHTLVETHGTYWHADSRFYSADNLNETQKKNVERDKRKIAFAISKGFKVDVVWESDI